MTPLSAQFILTLKDAAGKLSGTKKRAFQAQVAIDYLDSRPRLTETTLGWDRNAVALGLNELRTGIVCLGRHHASGNQKTEVKNPQLEIDIVALADPESQIDPKFQTPFNYTRLTAKALRAALITDKGWKNDDLPCEKTIGTILNRLGYRLRRVQKAKPLKKVKETDAIFKNVKAINQASDSREDSLRISIDTKAKVDLCDSSRGGTSRCQKPVQAADHDMGHKSKLVPFGILEVLTGLVTIIFGVSFETSDFIVDALERWWALNQDKHSAIRQLVINLDNGPNNSGQRTQFLKRMTEFADQYELEIVLVYYPPYHSKYNPIERCWGILESRWNATLLDTLEVTVAWAKSMTWKGIRPTVEVLQTLYEKGVTITQKAFQPIADRIIRDPMLLKYCLTIQPQTA